MLHSEPSKWEIFKVPPVQPIKYCSILKRRRELSQLIKRYEAQVHKHGYLHYCSIVPKSFYSSLNDESELLIVFLGDVPTTSFIGFRVNVNSETFIHESNSLILFLKQSEKAGLYFVNNNCIHVQCGKDVWEIFYRLYGIYLKKHVITVIGTQFFNDFVYQLCFQNEKQLLSMLCRGSKVIRVSKMSIYYRIHQKRKISVTDLIHMTLNMPESKRCIISFDSKESLTHSNIIDQNIYTAVGSKIHVSKLVINKFKRQYQDSSLENKYSEKNPLENVPSTVLNFHSKLVSPVLKTFKEDIENEQLIANSSVQKRKFEETENEFQRYSICSKVPKISVCLKKDNCWEQYTSLDPYPPKSYSSLLPSKSVVPDLFDNSKPSSHVNSLSNLDCNNFFSCLHSSKSPSVYLVKDFQNSLTLEETCDINSVQNINMESQSDANSIRASRFKEKIIMNECQKNAANDTSESLPSTQMHHCENSNPSLSKTKQMGLREDFTTTAAGKSIISKDAMLATQKFILDENHRGLNWSTVENKQFVKVPALKQKSLISCSVRNSKKDEINLEEVDSSNNYEADEIFTTAAGKNIIISKDAMLAAQKFILDENHQRLNRSSVENKQFVKVPTLKQKSLISCSVRNSKEDEINLEEVDSSNNYGLGHSYDRDSVTFHTASGKTINASKAAMKAANKLIQDVFEKEDNRMPSSSNSNTQRKRQAFKDIGAPHKKLSIEGIDDTMDRAFVEKFFQDANFDEKESEDVTESSRAKDFRVKEVSESKKNNEPTTRKIRKSLGGRRSMRFYSDT